MTDTTIPMSPMPEKLTPLDENDAVEQQSGNATSTASPMVSLMTGYLGSWKDERLKTLRPVGSFFDRSRLSLPKLTEIPSRFKTNIAYFQTNYLLVFFVLCLYSALTSPLFLIALIVVALMWLYMMKWRTGPYVIRGWEVPEKATTIGLILVTAFMFYISSATDIVFWLVIVTVSFVLLHALFYTPEPVDEFGFGADAAPPAFENVI